MLKKDIAIADLHECQMDTGSIQETNLLELEMRLTQKLHTILPLRMPQCRDIGKRVANFPPRSIFSLIRFPVYVLHEPAIKN